MFTPGQQVVVVNEKPLWDQMSIHKEDLTPYTVIEVSDHDYPCCGGHPQILTIRSANGKIHTASGYWFDKARYKFTSCEGCG